MTTTQRPRVARAAATAEAEPDIWVDLPDRAAGPIVLPRPAREAGPGSRPAREAPGSEPAREDEPETRRAPLRILPTDDLDRRARRRRARLTITVAVSLVVLSLLGVVVVNVMIAQDQLRQDHLDVQRDAALARKNQLQLQVAQLQSPQRIVGTAEQRLGMVVPSKLTYLSPNGAPTRSTGGGSLPAPLPPPKPPAPPPAATPPGPAPPGQSTPATTTPSPPAAAHPPATAAVPAGGTPAAGTNAGQGSPGPAGAP